jgi:hypothetical protein
MIERRIQKEIIEIWFEKETKKKALQIIRKSSVAVRCASVR